MIGGTAGLCGSAPECEPAVCECSEGAGKLNCGGDIVRCSVECVVQRVVLRCRTQGENPILQWLFGPKQESVFVEICRRSNAQSMRTGMATRIQDDVLPTGVVEETWVWGRTSEPPDNASTSSFTGSRRLIFEHVPTTSEFAITVLKEVQPWVHYTQRDDKLPSELLGEACFKVDEDVANAKGIQGELTLPLIFQSRICGSIVLVVRLRAHDLADVPTLGMARLGSELAEEEESEHVLGNGMQTGAMPPRVELVKVGSRPVPTHPVRLEGHTGTVACCATFPSGGRVLTGSHDNTAIIWSDQGEQFAVLRGHVGPVSSCDVFPAEDAVVTASEEEGVGIIWSLTGAQCAVLRGATSCQVFPSGHHVLTTWRGDREAEGAAIFSRTGELIKTHLGHIESMGASTILPCGQSMLCTSGPEAVVWSMEGRTLRVLRGHTGTITACAALPSPSGCVLTVARDATGIIWHTEKRHGEAEKHSVVLQGHEGCLTACAVLPTIEAVLTVAEDKRAIVWSYNGELLVDFKAHDAALSACAVFPANGGILGDDIGIVTASVDGAGIVWTLAAKGTPNEDESPSFEARQRGELRGHMQAIRSCAVLPFGDRVLTTSEDGTAMLWPVAPLLDGFRGRRVQTAPAANAD